MSNTRKILSLFLLGLFIYIPYLTQTAFAADKSYQQLRDQSLENIQKSLDAQQQASTQQNQEAKKPDASQVGGQPLQRQQRDNAQPQRGIQESETQPPKEQDEQKTKPSSPQSPWLKPNPWGDTQKNPWKGESYPTQPLNQKQFKMPDIFNQEAHHGSQNNHQEKTTSHPDKKTQPSEPRNIYQ